MALAEDEVERLRESFRVVEAERLAVVRYVNLDYQRDERAPGASGPRVIVDDVEWLDPTWKYASCDSVDYGIELVTDAGSMISIYWTPPSTNLESLMASNVPLIGGRLDAARDVAVWDLSTRSTQWSPLLGKVIGIVELHLEEWVAGSDERWLPHLTLPIGSHRVDVVLGEAAPDAGEYVEPASTNLAIVIDALWRLDRLT